MAEMIARRVGLDIFKKHIAAYEPADPLYETYVDKKGRTRKRRREIPPGLSARDAKILKKVQRRAHYLDKGMSLCGLRVGWTFWIGLIPFAGDVADASLNYFLVVKKAQQAEIPEWLLQRMLFNNGISAAVGFIPIVGDVILATYKANSRNAYLLEEFLRIRGQQFMQAGGTGAAGGVGGTPGRGKGKGSPGVLPGAGVAHGEVVTHDGKSTVRGTKAAPTAGSSSRSGFLSSFRSKPAAAPVTQQEVVTTQAPTLPARA